MHERSIEGCVEYEPLLRETRGTAENDVLVYVLDLFEGVLRRDWSAGRRFANEQFLKTMLELLSLRCFVCSADGSANIQLPAMVYVKGAAGIEVSDLVMVHYANGEHYDAVRVMDGELWQVAEETRARLAKLVRQWPLVCLSVRVRSRGRAAVVLCTHLQGERATGAMETREGLRVSRGR